MNAEIEHLVQRVDALEAALHEANTRAVKATSMANKLLAIAHKQTEAMDNLAKRIVALEASDDGK